jgi:hypothetical protein
MPDSIGIVVFAEVLLCPRKTYDLPLDIQLWRLGRGLEATRRKSGSPFANAALLAVPQRQQPRFEIGTRCREYIIS